jgi:very-short-patch-repair endonuclease
VPARLGGVSALQVHGLRGIEAKRVDVVVAARRQIAPLAGVAIHRARLSDEDRHPWSHPPTTTIGRAVVDAASWARSDREAQLIILACFQQRLVTAAEIHDALDRMPTTARRRLVVLTVRDACAGSHTLGELDLVRLCRESRLPLPSRQVSFRDSSGRRRYLDAVFDEWRVAVEVDGAHHDRDVVQRWDDIDRDLDLVLAGYRVLRLTAVELRQHRRHAVEKIRAVLTEAGWSAHPGRGRQPGVA